MQFIKIDIKLFDFFFCRFVIKLFEFEKSQILRWTTPMLGPINQVIIEDPHQPKAKLENLESPVIT